MILNYKSTARIDGQATTSRPVTNSTSTNCTSTNATTRSASNNATTIRPPTTLSFNSTTASAPHRAPAFPFPFVGCPGCHLEQLFCMMAAEICPKFPTAKRPPPPPCSHSGSSTATPAPAANTTHAVRPL